MATHSSILGREVPFTEDPGRLQSTGQTEVSEQWCVKLNTSYMGSLSQDMIHDFLKGSSQDESHEKHQK